ncbi:hypothetical protein GJ496_010543, partial [Pomphorhynchus laevis]
FLSIIDRPTDSDKPLFSLSYLLSTKKTHVFLLTMDRTFPAIR